MKDASQDVLTYLEDRLKDAIDEVERLKTAIRAYKGDVGINSTSSTSSSSVANADDKPQPKSTKTKRIRWKPLITELFEKHNQLSVEEIQKMLADQGVPEAETNRGRNGINTVLARLVDKNSKEYARVSTGVYAKIGSKPERDEIDELLGLDQT